MNETLQKRINNTNDELDRKWGISFLIEAKEKKELIQGGRYDLDIKSYVPNYGADVEKAYYDPMTRNNPISIPYRKQKISGYWNDGKETDYIQFVNGNDKLIFISNETIKKYKDSPIHRGNIPLPTKRQKSGYFGYSMEDSIKIWNSYIEIPKSEVEVWVKSGNKENWKWEKV